MGRKGVAVLEAVKDEVVAYYAAGNSLPECGTRFGVSSNTIRRMLVFQGVSLRSYRESISLHWKKAKATGHPRCNRLSKYDSILDEIAASYRSGNNSVEIGERFKISPVIVRWLLRRAKVTVRSKEESQKLCWSTGSRSKSVRMPEAGPYQAIEDRARLQPTTQATFDFTIDGPAYLCPKCNRVVPQDGWRYHNDPRYRDKRRKEGCASCINAYQRENHGETKLRYSRDYYRENREKIRQSRRETRQGILDAYGGRCACCDESTHEFLAIDHAQGGGIRHRLHLHARGYKGQLGFYRWLRENGFPPEFRVLCHNCNASHGHYGYCPHVEDRSWIEDFSHLSGAEFSKAKQTACRRQIRLDLISGYGGKCDCCGEQHIEFLAIDHTAGDGAEDRKRLKEEGINGYAFFSKIITDGFPDRYRLLCHNCNFSSGKYGKCPHVKESS